jgi:hypothetical protein
MKGPVFLCVLATVLSQCCGAEVNRWSITKQDVREAIEQRYAIVEVVVEESHLTGVGKRSEGTSYRLKCLETLSRGDSMIVTDWTRDYYKEPALKRRRYILILDGRTYWRAEESDSGGRRKGEIVQWIGEGRARK